MSRQIELLRARRFLPMFATQLLGAFNDNLFKSAFIMLVTYGSVAEAGGGIDPGALSALAGGALIAPYFLFSATAGQLADRTERSRLLRVLKGAELVVVAISAMALLTGSLALSLCVLFLLGTQATFASPVKYALIPQHLASDELVDGNALMEGGTFLSILLGTIAGGITVAIAGGTQIAAAALLVCAIAGFAAAFRVPPAPAPSPGLRLSWNLAAATRDILRQAREQRSVWLSILGASWFWVVGAVFLSQMPTFAKLTLGAGSGVVTLFLAAFSVGVGFGSSLCGRLMHGEVSARYVPLAALAMAAFSLDLALTSRGIVPASAEVTIGVAAFLSRFSGLHIFLDLVAVAVAGGFFVVPLYAIIQQRSDEAARARIVAANNVMNALFMAAAAVVTAVLIALGMRIPDLFLVLGVISLGVALWICRLLPQDVMRMMFRAVLRAAYRVEVHGLENLAPSTERLLIAPNHVSFLDGPLIAAFIPGSPLFAIDTGQTTRWYVKPLLAAVEVYAMDPTRPMATKSLVRAVRDGRQCVVFPEGRINVVGGALMKIYDGSAMVADKADALVQPVRIDGAELTPFSRLAGRVRRHWFPKITLTILPARRLTVDEALRGRARRQAAATALYDVMSEMMALRPDPPSLFAALLAARAQHGGGQKILRDPIAGELSYDRVVTGALILGRRLAQKAAPGATIGLLLPNSLGAALAFLGLQATGRVPAMLNHTAGGDSVLSACRTAGLQTVVTSRRFVEIAKIEPLIARLGSAVEIVWLEDVRARIGVLDKLRGWLAARSPERRHRRLGIKSSDPAVILFTSGSEGAPKGVALSHANLLANRRQLAARIDFNPTDKLLNVLPLFHSFGLTAGFLLPLLSGVRTFLYPSPLHYRIVPEVAYDIGATILFGTDTFLAGYARVANPYDFQALRYVFAGAEKVRDETRAVWAERFGKRILEGYGVTECSPVVAVNTPMHYRSGAVGRMLPLMEYRLEPVEGIDAGGRLLVRGPNVMSGYLLPDRAGAPVPPEDGWYDTGDIVSLDATGFVTIVGRAKRFAKVAGEMVSLTVAERVAEIARPGMRHAVVALPDARKGEKLVLVTEAGDLRRDALVAAAHDQHLPELAVAREIVAVDRLPLLGSGKTDYPTVLRLANEAGGPVREETEARAPEDASLVAG